MRRARWQKFTVVVVNTGALLLSYRWSLQAPLAAGMFPVLVGGLGYGLTAFVVGNVAEHKVHAVEVEAPAVKP